MAIFILVGLLKTKLAPDFCTFNLELSKMVESRNAFDFMLYSNLSWGTNYSQ